MSEDSLEDQLGRMIRPSGIPIDHEPLAITTETGRIIIGWGRLVETTLPNGSKKSTVDSFIPEG